MPSIYELALGEEFKRLHPMIQRRFSLSSESGIAAIGTGVMEELWHGAIYTLPFLYVGAWRSIMFPEQGRNVPFSIRNFAYRDKLGRETVTWIRTFNTANGRVQQRRFDAYMIYSEQRGRIVDYLGTHQHLAVDIDISVATNGGIAIRSGEQRFYEGPLGFRFPLALSGIAEVCEWFDDDAAKYRIEVNVRNRTWGPLFGYRGSFDVEWLAAPTLHPDLLPKRVEPRE
ncbi:MAG: DUF4166 domain-containing protein [Edaphobacter sp.]